MTINGRRRFMSNTGRRYIVQNLMKQDRERYPGKNYYMLVAEKGSSRYKVCLGYTLNMELFTTIKEAQRYVRDWEFTIQML